MKATGVITPRSSCRKDDTNFSALDPSCCAYSMATALQKCSFGINKTEIAAALVIPKRLKSGIAAVSSGIGLSRSNDCAIAAFLIVATDALHGLHSSLGH